MSTCKDTQKFRTSEASTKAAMRTQGAIDKFLNIIDLGLFRTLNGKWSRDAKERFNVQKMLFSEADGGRKAVPNKEAFKQIDNAKGIYYQQEEVSLPASSPETLVRVKKAIEKMGISIQDLATYAKQAKLDVTNINGLADLTKGIIAIAEGKEGVALTEEMVHIATAIMEQTNPQLVTQMISKIGSFKIYRETYEQYKNNPNYQVNGKPDIRKIKKEAVDKLITEVIINGVENIEQYPELQNEANLSTIRLFWNSVLDFIRSLYTKSNISLFQEAAEQILGEGVGTVEQIVGEGTYYQQVTDKQKIVQDKIQQTKDNIKKVVSDEPVDPVLSDSEEASNYYEVKQPDGTFVRVTKRVTDRVKAWYKQKFGTKKFTDFEKSFNEAKRKFGVEGHKDLEEIHARFYNEDGTRKETPDKRPNKFNVSSQEMYAQLETYYLDTVNALPKDTLVFSEVVVFDPKQGEAGTIDFLAVEPDGKTSVLDWKFMYISKNQTDVPWFKQGAYDIQIGRYKQMLRDNYDVKSFGKLRAIPFLMEFEFSKDKQPVLTGLATGSADASQITDMRLVPVSEQTESTGEARLDAVIAKLNGLVRQLSKEKVSDEEERQLKNERSNKVRQAIRLVQSTQNIRYLIDVIEVTRKEGERILREYETSYKNIPAGANDFENSQLSDFADDMNSYIKLSEVFENISREIDDLIYTPQMEKEATSDEEKEEIAERKKILNGLRAESDSIFKSKTAIIQAAQKFADKHIGEKNLVKGLTKAEAVIKGLGSLFRGVSDLPLRSLQVLYKLTRAAQGKASEESFKEVEDLMAIRKKLAERGGDLRKLVQKIYQKDSEGKMVNHLIYKYSKKFFEQVDEKAAKGGDMEWLLDNINVEAYKQEAEKIMAKRIANINNNQYAGTEEEVEQTKKNLIAEVEREFDIENKDFSGFNNYVIKRHPQDKWFSEEYKEVSADPDLLDLYNFITKVNAKAKESGYIRNQTASTFLPFVRKTMAEQLVWDNKLSVMSNFYNSLQISPDDVGYGEINEVTGELENSIPKYYTYDFSKTEEGVNDYSQVSEDLFKNMILYVQQLNKYKYLSDVEGQLKLVKTIEEFKGHLNTNRVGNVVKKDGKLEELPGNEQNTKMYDDFLRVLLYDQKYVLSDSDTPLNIDKVLNFVKKGVNAVAGKEVWKENEKPTATSLMKTIDAANRGFQLKTLGFEFISGAVNAFGGNIQMATQAGNYFRAREFAKNEAKIIKQDFSSNEDKEAFIQLINTFMPLKDDPAYEEFKKAGMSKLTQSNLGDILMVFMRYPEQVIEKSVFLTLLENTMVENGKLVNINEYVKSKYKDRYNSSASYKASKEAMDKEVEELKKTRAISAIKKIEDGQLIIPGLDLSNRDELQRLTNLTRRISRNATGGMSDGDVNRMSMSIWTKSMMVFKNWIPKLADTRFSEFRKVSDDFSVIINEEIDEETGETVSKISGEKYDIGRLRLLGYVLGSSIQDRSTNLLNIMKMNDAGIDKLNEYYEDFAKKYEEETGEELNMSREDFIDMVRTNLRNQIKELSILFSLMGAMFALGFVAPDDDEDKATKNMHRYTERVIDKFVSELSFFYNPAEFQQLLSGSMFPAIGLTTDATKFGSNLFTEITGIDSKSETSYDEARKKAQPIKYAMKMFPVTKSVVTYLSILNDEFAREFDVTIQKQSNR
jgi:hypothetical protein